MSVPSSDEETKTLLGQVLGLVLNLQTLQAELAKQVSEYQKRTNRALDSLQQRVTEVVLPAVPAESPTRPYRTFAYDKNREHDEDSDDVESSTESFKKRSAISLRSLHPKIVASTNNPSQPPIYTSRVILTTYFGQAGITPIPLIWGHSNPHTRGPIVASRIPSSMKLRNAVGAHGGAYSIYHALAIAIRELDAAHTPNLHNTEPVCKIGPFPSWNDPECIVSLDPWGHVIMDVYKDDLAKGIDIRPTIAITKAHMKLLEVEEAVRKGRLIVDGKIVVNDLGDLMVTKGGMYPELITRPDLKVFLPPIGGLSIYIMRPPEYLSDPSKVLTLRVHDECNGSDVFGSDICTCRPYLIYGIEEAVKTAQNGGIGLIVYFRKEGCALGEVTKYLVYNARKRAEGGDTAKNYFLRTENIAGVKDMRFQATMPDKYDAIVGSGIPILERVPIPADMLPPDSQVEIDAKIASGYFSYAAAPEMDGTTIDPIALVPQHIRSLFSTAKRSLPWTQTTPTGLVAIIDISGYSKLSSHLQEVLGNDSGAKIKELLNPPMEVIIENVHQTGGSIVKFAGDAVIAYTVSVEETAPAISRKASNRDLSTVVQSSQSESESIKSMSSMELESAKSIARNPSRSAGTSKSNNYSRKLSFTVSGPRKFVSQPLKVHIGLGFGETQQVHIGIENGLKFAKSEFFIAGKALTQSGILLEKGQRGEFAFDKICWDILQEEISVELKVPIKISRISDTEEAYIISENNSLDDLISSLEDRMGEFQFNPGQLDTGLERTPMKFDPSILDELSAYMDDTLGRAMLFAKKRVQADSTPDKFAANLKIQIDSIFEAYDQLRNLSVIFIQFPDFKVDTIAEKENLEKLQSLMEAIMKSMFKFEGTLRQMNCDDKALTALIVWGLQGHAHEKGESGYALSAAFDMAKRFESIVGSSFSIGITNGPVFSGIIGNRTRADGTVLGVAVNNAARLMCLDICKGSILCDEATFNATKDEYIFDIDIPLVQLKGALNPVKIYQPLTVKEKSETQKLVLCGRDQELQIIRNSISAWMAGERQLIAITARTGLGKTALLQNFVAEIFQEQAVIVCTGRGQEHQKTTMLFSYGQILSELIIQVQSRKLDLSGLSGTLSNSMLQKSSSLPSANYLKSSTDSLGDILKTHEFISSVFPQASWDILASVPGLMCKTKGVTPVISDLVTKLSVFLTKIFSGIPKIAIVIDDFQEHKDSTQADFQKILDLSELKHLKLEPISETGIEMLIKTLLASMGRINSVDPKLTSEVLSQSQGNPLIASSIISLMKESGHITLENDIMVLSQKQMVRKQLGGGDSVVTAQFDRLTLEMKELLRAASVAGQYFNVNDVVYVLNETTHKSKKLAKNQILNIIRLHDSYHFTSHLFQFSSLKAASNSWGIRELL
ncbi:hypothetical protein HK100_012785 [Physocladia obscura]|uniref:Guanylate cyclase domain-containing protein n=1 Tax=Physocladia obscura TaxID=109957 RepID=A0AAD5XG04_9FUNG|nr:hypothetical protein HK100_012785 [Physocladia obscura]